MTYVSESMRGALVPSIPHIRPWICLVVLAGSLAVLIWIGVRGFYRRALD
jgi:ABC-2 type transport system permease protein